MSLYEESKLDYMIDIYTTRVSAENHQLEALNKGTMMYAVQLSVVRHETDVLEFLKELKDTKEKLARKEKELKDKDQMIRDLEERCDYCDCNENEDYGYVRFKFDEEEQ